MGERQKSAGKMCSLKMPLRTSCLPCCLAYVCITSREILPAGKILTRVLPTSCGISSKVSVGLELVLTMSRELIFLVPAGKISHEGSEKGVVISFAGRFRSSSTSQGWWWRKDCYNGHVTHVMDSPNDPHPEVRLCLTLFHLSRKTGVRGKNAR